MSKKYKYRPEVAKQDGVKEIDENQDGQIDKLEIEGQQETFTAEKAYVEGQERPKGYELVEEPDLDVDSNNASGQQGHTAETTQTNPTSGTQIVPEGTVPSEPKQSTDPQPPASPAPGTPEPPVASPAQPESGNPAPAAGTEHHVDQPPSKPEGQAEGEHQSQPQQGGPEDNKHQEEKKPDQNPSSETNQQQPQGPAENTPSQGNPGSNPSSGSGTVQADLTPITDTAEQIPQEPAPKLSEAESFGQSIKQRIDAYARDMGPNVSQTEASLVRHQVDLYHIFQTVLTVSEYDKFEAGIKALYAGFQENYALCFNYDARFRGIMNIPVSKLKEDQVEVLTSLIDLFCRLASAKSLVDLRGTYNFKTLKDNIYDQFVLSRFLGFVKKVIGDE